MKAMTLSFEKNEVIKATVLDVVSLAFIYFIPGIAHLLSFPVYMIEPMRLMLVVSFVITGKKNSYLLALTLPLFSFAVSGHPEFVKMLIITSELLLNVFLFYLFADLFKGKFLAAITSIIASKVFAYFLYLVFFSFAFVKSEASPAFLGVQVLTTLIFSIYIYIATKKSLPEKA
jgi:hypothetical protein